MTIQLKHLGDTAYTLVFAEERTPGTTATVAAATRAVNTAIANGSLIGAREAVPTFCSLTVYFDPLRVSDMLAQQLVALVSAIAPEARGGRLWRLPVCIDDDFAPDLADVATAGGLSINAVLALLWESRFTVGMLGFMPGFPYMAGWPAHCAVARLPSPRLAVPAGSVAVTGTQCAIYPWQSPGGWRLLGRTPVSLFDADNNTAPALLAPGDEVCFSRIDRQAFDQLKAHPQPRTAWQVNA